MKNTFIKASILMPFLFLITLSVGCQCNKGTVKVEDKTKKEKGRINVEILNLNKGFNANTSVLKLNITGTLIEGEGEQGSTSFNRSQSYEKGGTSVASENFPNLRPGRWEVSVSFGSWNTRCEKTVPKNGSAKFDFKYGRLGCE